MSFHISNKLPPKLTDIKQFDPELLYVECRHCGSPLLWGAGQTTAMLLGAGVDISRLDASCLLLSERCPNCQPNIHEFSLSVVKLPQSGLVLDDALQEIIDSLEEELNTNIRANNIFKLKSLYGHA
ncbi:hypothetical protein [Desulfovibrio litoralis]|uniref:Uncharacterized protein n=1 Tax=Desulfovibrio litoralis DSM 11393 TaxID=1121455 RepID=A0A1M7SBB6_9BACT|nr:hypothetical protein [Desulfovibrio litoralis]SHN55674.1 hypothetical protein SAMN02745728_00704 [Desulfovibrio litoralis DSM 11393]